MWLLKLYYTYSYTTSNYSGCQGVIDRILTYYAPSLPKILVDTIIIRKVNIKEEGVDDEAYYF